MPGIRCSIGPLGKTVEDCALVMKSLLNENFYSQLSIVDRNPYYLLSTFDN